MKNQPGIHSSDKILAAATRIAQAHGYGGLNIRHLADEVGIKAASIYHHFPSKAELAAAVARRYWENTAAVLKTLSTEMPDALGALRHYPLVFRKALENGNRICLCSFMAAEYDDLPDVVKKEVQAFADVNIAWLGQMLLSAGAADAKEAALRGQAIFAAVAGAQLMARGRSDIALFDALIECYCASGLLPA